MQLSKQAKIALVLGILLLLVIIFVIWANNKNKQLSSTPAATATSTSGDIYAPGTTGIPADQSILPESSPTATSSDQINYISPVAGATISPAPSSTKITARTPIPVDANGVKKYFVSVTPAPNAGYFDYTKTMGGYQVADYTNSKFAKQTPCQIMGLDDSWSNLVEKMSCDGLNFLASNVTDALNQINCAFTASAIQANYDPNVTYKLEDGKCFIIDRTK